VTAVAGQPRQRRMHPFRGIVERIDGHARTITVSGEAVDGWMGAMTMVYALDDADIVSAVTVGDRISATVEDGDFRTLHAVRVLGR
jgi:Cu/Ag efflux protein CusF